MAKKESKLVAGIRKQASGLKSKKEAIAGVALQGIAAAQQVMEYYAAAGKAVAVAADAGVQVCGEVLKRGELRSQVQTLIGNAVSDVANRMNEFANIVESASGTPGICAAFEQAKKAFADLEKAAEKPGKKPSHLRSI